MQSKYDAPVIHTPAIVDTSAIAEETFSIKDHSTQAEEGVKDGVWDGKGRWRKKPQKAFWRFILVGGDMLLVISLFTWVFFFLAASLHLQYQIVDDWFQVWQGKLLFLCFFLVCWNLAVRLTNAQNLSYASNRFRGPFCAFLALIILTFLAMTVVDPLIGTSFKDSAQVSLLFLGVSSPLVIVWRVIFARLRNLPRFRRKGIIVGADSATRVLFEEMQHVKLATIDIVGSIQEGAYTTAQIDDFPVLGNRYTLRTFVEKQVIDTIIVAGEHGTSTELFQETIDAVQFGVEIVPIAMILESISGRVPVKHIGNQWYSMLPIELSVSPWYMLWERVLNFTFGICGFLLLLVVLPIIAVLTYLESPGPIFYTQQRLGFQGKPFRVYKFRSMRLDAESAGRAVWASKNDPRTTRIGRFMRATHLDELPQVINILRGEMGLIGPRPERAEFVSELEKTIPFYHCRLAIKPGLTGWAQVKYRYGNTDNDALIKLQYDLYYIKRRSFMLDVFIVLNTVLEVLERRGV